MYLISENDENYNIYKMLPKEKELESFKRREIESVHVNSRVFTIKTTKEHIVKRLEEQNSSFNDYELNTSHNDAWTSEFTSASPQKDSVNSREIQDKFCKNLLTKEKIHLVQKQKILNGKFNVENLYSFLITEGPTIDKYTMGNCYTFKNSLLLPLKLYYLYLFEKGAFRELESINVNEYLELFTITKENELSKEQVENLIKYGLISEVEMKRKIDNDKYLISRLRQEEKTNESNKYRTVEEALRDPKLWERVDYYRKNHPFHFLSDEDKAYLQTFKINVKKLEREK